VTLVYLQGTTAWQEGERFGIELPSVDPERVPLLL
jgi:hypothetical protein